MTGAGFGGCAIALVKKERAKTFIGAVDAQLRSRLPAFRGAFEVRPVAGATVAKE